MDISPVLNKEEKLGSETNETLENKQADPKVITSLAESSKTSAMRSKF